MTIPFSIIFSIAVMIDRQGYNKIHSTHPALEIVPKQTGCEALGGRPSALVLPGSVFEDTRKHKKADPE